MTPAVATPPLEVRTTREFLLDRPALPVLIRVPALRTAARRRALRRRRLRREVRLGGMAILLGAPLFALGALIPGTETPTLEFPSASLPDGRPSPSPGADGALPPQVSLLPELEPVPAPDLDDNGAGEGVQDDEHWVAAWSEAPGAGTEPGPMPGAEPQPVRTSGYLLPVLPDMGRGQGGEESPHAGP